tara:strand:+ start:637 stop:867 length:231 start_codon:yes stop_codon:yes gene_type:complete
MIMAEKTETPTVDEQKKKGMELLNQISRSAIAVIDTVTQRGGFRGEELSTIGNLRDQCTQGVQVVESWKQEEAEAE